MPKSLRMTVDDVLEDMRAHGMSVGEIKLYSIVQLCTVGGFYGSSEYRTFFEGLGRDPV